MAHRDFLARRFAMNIDNDVRSFLTHLGDGRFDRAKWILQNRLHECTALHVYHADLAFGCFEHDRSAAGAAGGVVLAPPYSRHRPDNGEDTILSADVFL